MLNLGKAAQADPSLGDALENSGDLSIDQLATRYNSVPQSRQPSPRPA